MLREISRIELAAWFAYLKVGSLDDEKADTRMAVIATAAMNGPHFLKRDKRPYDPADFLPEPEGERKAAQISQKIRSIFKGMGK